MNYNQCSSLQRGFPIWKIAKGKCKDVPQQRDAQKDGGNAALMPTPLGRVAKASYVVGTVHPSAVLHRPAATQSHGANQSRRKL